MSANNLDTNMSTSTYERNLTEREAAVLKALVYEYISSGKPVGSRTFVSKYSFSLSPATMRNVMFDLEYLGYLTSPHTSSGRMPTNRGYRFYVDMLLDTYENILEAKMNLRDDYLKKEIQLDKMLSAITRMLSVTSHYAGMVLTPKADFAVLKHIEIVPLDMNEVLVVLVTRTGVVLNKRVSISESVTSDDLHKFSKYLTSELGGYSLYDIRGKIFDKLREAIPTGNEFQMALDIAQLALNGLDEPDVHIEGIENILHIPEMIESDRLKGFLKIIEEKKLLASIMERCIGSEGVFTLIGDEIAEETISGCSIITSSYKIGNESVGVIGIIGPTRMDYNKVVPLVDYAGKIVSDLLTKMSK
jgi:heat-inducible transcriptional repressor